MKRSFDFCLSLVALLILMPALVLIAAWVRLDSPGPVFFRQIRVGLRGVPFSIHKFRTMHVDPTRSGPQITIGSDPRVTRAGRFLRRYKLDELPQLIDVLVGRMSIVGPRPEVPRYMDAYPPEVRAKVLSVRPGITDWASLEFRDEARFLSESPDPEKTYVEVVLPLKQRHYLRYVADRSLYEDIRIIICTIAAVFRG